MANAALQKAVALTGGQKALADLLGTRQSLVWYWLERSKKGVPAEYVEAIVRCTDGRVTPHELRPDIFSAAAPAPAEAAA